MTNPEPLLDQPESPHRSQVTEAFSRGFPGTAKSDRAFVFDLGGVVLRWRPEEVVRQSLPHRANDPETVRHWVAQIFQSFGGEWQNFDRGTLDEPELARQISIRTGLTQDEVLAVVAACPAELEPQPRTIAWLERLQAQGRDIFFLSNMPDPFARGFEHAEYFTRLFKSGIFSSRINLVKPEPAMFAAAAEAFGLPPSHLLLLDDHLPNILAARAAGWQAVHFIDADNAEAEVERLDW